MTVITIREREGTESSPNADLFFDHGERFPITITDPFSEQEEARLEWYFEEHIRFPFTGEVKAEKAAKSVAAYGQALFEQIFADRAAWACYREAVQAGLETLRFEIAGSPDFHRLHWEALKDPDLPQPLALQALMVRRNLVPQTVRARVRRSPTINLLIVSARPGAERDVGYRTISRPLVEGLQQAELRVRVEIVRPGSYKALSDHLERVQDRQGTGFYHAIHFDVHGALCTFEELKEDFEAGRLLYMTRYGRDEIEPYEGLKAFLFLEGEKEGQADPVEAEEVAELLLTHQVPIAILNACQSGKQVGAAETSLGSRLTQAGVQMVLAMGYSVTVSAAELMMASLYKELFAGQELPDAIRRARLELHNQKGRRAYFDQTVDLEDWLLPVVYQNRDQALEVREFTAEEGAAYYERQARRYRPPETAYGFVGRDLDVLQVERRLLADANGRRNILLVRGMGGAGKTTLLHHLGAWWQATRFADRVFYFGYDEQAWTRQQVLHTIARGLMDETEYYGSFQPLSLDAQQAMLAERLRARRHLLVLDNVESITGSHLAVRNILPEEERAALRGLLADLAGGRTLVLLGSRGGEEWLAPGTFGQNVYELPGLDPEAASTLADRVLARNKATKYRQDPDLERLLKLLDGYPLAIEVMLGNLARQTPAQVLEALQTGDVAFDKGDAQSKTESILRCIDYSHSNLSPEAQGLLACLAPFTGVVYTGALEQYTARLKAQPALAHLPFERWAEVLQEAANWGLLSPHPGARGYLRLQPTLPYFLRSRLAAEEQAEARGAIETAFREHYDGLGRAIAGLMTSKDAQEKQTGQALARLEYENLVTALNLALVERAPFYGAFSPMYEYLLLMQEGQRRLDICRAVITQEDQYSAEQLSGEIGVHFYLVLARLARTHLALKQYDPARENYEQALDIATNLRGLPEETKGNYVAIMYHQLGRVAEEQRQWAQAERHYQQALEIKIEFNDRYSQAKTYNQSGIVAQAQRQWAQAERHCQQALEIFIEFNDRYSQAKTYHQLGIVAQEQRQWAQAERHYQQALEIKIEFNDRYSQAKTYHQLGIVAQEQRQWAQAERHYQQALEIKIEFNDRYSQANTYHNLGVVAQEQRQWAQARQYFLRSLETYHAYEDSHSISIVMRSLARIWQASDDEGLPEAMASILDVPPREVEAGLRQVLAGDQGEGTREGD